MPKKKKVVDSPSPKTEWELALLREENARKDKLNTLAKDSTQKVYKVGDRVQQVKAVLIEGIPRNKGEVLRHDIGSKFLFVSWDDGCKYWTDVQCVEPTPEKRRKSKG